MTPVPLSVTLCGLPAALSLIVTLAPRLPLADGVKVTLIVQLAPAASVLGLMGQVLVCAKSPAFVPATVMLVIVRAAVPLFVSVTDLAALVVPTFWAPKLRLVGFSVTAGAETVPVPESATLCGLPAALSLIVTLALRLPVAVGENVTLSVQVAPAASVLGLSGQVFVCAKSPALAPLTPMLLIVNAAVPLLVSVTDFAALVVPTSWLPKLSDVGLSVTPGAGVTPVPLSATLCGLPPASSLMLTLALRPPFAEGVNVTLSVQFAPAASVFGLSGQVFVCAKSAAFVPLTEMLVMVSAAEPLFVSVTALAALVVPTF